MLLLLLLGCSEYSLDGKPDDGAGFDTSDSGPPGETGDSARVEECNGLDDDGDGLVDEDFPDDNGDGVADCLAVDCPTLVVAVAGEYPVDDTCLGAPTTVEDPWSYVVEWGFVQPTVDYGSVVPPLVANLSDDNRDGVIDSRDSPDVLVTGSGGFAYILDGATGTQLRRISGFYGWATPVIADVDRDGIPDVLSVDTSGHVARYSPTTAARLAVSTETVGYWDASSIADLDGDGRPEIVVGDGIFDAITLDLLARFGAPTSGYIVFNAVGDVDQDGDQEIFRHGALYDSDGSPLWDAGLSFEANASYALMVQADADDDAELVLVAERYYLFDTDGTLLAVGPVFAGWGAGAGPPSAADFDGDGVMEVAYPVYYEGPFVMMELDGTEAWSTPTPWRTMDAGVTGFDLDGDGAKEILYAADEAFYVYDGRTGATRFEYGDHRSPTAFEQAVVADVDGDGHAEIVMVSPTAGRYQISVLGHAGAGWPEVGPVWGQHDYAGVQIDEDGTVPASPDAAWLTSQTWRAVASETLLGVVPDLVVAITDVCVADCTYGTVQVAVRVANQGAGDVTGESRLVLYAVDDAGPRAIAEARVGPVAAGTKLEGIVFDLSPADIGQRGYLAVVDADGEVVECDEDDNTDEWADSTCP